jgi:hypothetical protein
MMPDYRALLRPRPKWPWAAWILAAVLLAAAGWLAALAMQTAGDTAQRQVALKAEQARRRQRPAPPPSRATQDEQKRWAALAMERAFSWYPVFRALEQANSPDIELLEFLPDKGSRRIALRGEAHSVGTLTDYLASLSEQQVLAEVYLAKQKNINRGGMTPVSFEIRASLAESAPTTTGK